MNPRNDRANLMLWGITHGRPGYRTEYLRRDRARRLRLGDWLPVLVVGLCLLVLLAVYTVPTWLHWIEAGL